MSDRVPNMQWSSDNVLLAYGVWQIIKLEGVEASARGKEREADCGTNADTKLSLAWESAHNLGEHERRPRN